MSQTTRFRFSASAIERLAFPADATLSIKTVEFSDLDCPGLKLSIARAGSKTFWFRFVLATGVMLAWLAARGRSFADGDITFYSDSRNDLPLLEKSQNPVATNPDDTLRAIATERGWRILELFPQEENA